MPNNNPQGENQYTKGDHQSGRNMGSGDDNKSSKSSSGSSGSHKSGSGRSSDDDNSSSKSGSHSSRQR